MAKFRSILLAPLASASDELAPIIASIVQHHGARLTLAGVVAEPTKLQAMLQSVERLEAAAQHAIVDARAELQELEASIDGIDGHIEVRMGHPAEALLDMVSDTGADLLIVATDEGPGLDPLTKTLLRRCACPVWVMNPTRGARGNNVLAAINPEPSEADLNRTIIEYAIEAQAWGGGTLHLLAAWTYYGESALRQSAFLYTPEGELERLLEAEHDEHRKILEDLVSTVDLEGTDAIVHLVKGHPDEVITEAIEQLDIDHLVLATMARQGLSGWFFGNTAERLIDQASVSLFAIKPPGFSTP